MAVPKRRNSKTRGAKRRTHYKIRLSSVVKCSSCGHIKDLTEYVQAAVSIN